MNKVGLLIIACLSLRAAIEGISSAAEDAQGGAWGEAVDGLQICVVFSKRKYGPSEPVSCEVRMRNLLDKPFALPAYEPIVLFPFKITDSVGRSLGYTRLGKRCLDAAGINAGHIDGKVDRATIKKGETYIVRVTDLNRLLDLTVAGTYDVTVSAKWPEYPGRTVAVESRKVTVSIEEPEYYQMYSESTVPGETPGAGKESKQSKKAGG